MISYFSLIIFAAARASAEEFAIVSRYPASEDALADHHVLDGEPLTLTCQANRKFNLCRWGRPGWHPCGIFSADGGKECSREGGGSAWRVHADSPEACSVTVDAVSASADAGEWNCELQSYPNERGQYESAQVYTNLVRE